MMSIPTVRRFPAWLRTIAWFIFLLWLLAACVSPLWWRFTKRAQARAQAIVATVPRPISGNTGDNGVYPVHFRPLGESGPEIERGTPVRELPVVGPLLDGDAATIEKLKRERDNLSEFLKWIGKCRVDGKIDFKQLLGHLGIQGVEGLSDKDAAAEFLRWARSASLLADDWKKALETGTWDFTGVDLLKPCSPEIGESIQVMLGRFGTQMQSLWGAMAEASWQTGDADSAFRHWKFMMVNAERTGDATSMLGALVESSQRSKAVHTLETGLSVGGFTDAQLAQLIAHLADFSALDSMRRGLDGEKRIQESLFARIGTSDDPLTFRWVNPFNKPSLNFLNKLAMSLVTPQQIADNLAVAQASTDAALSRFDPISGNLIPPGSTEVVESAAFGVGDSWFDRFYFMYSMPPLGNSGIAKRLEATVVDGQSSMDQARLAVALESHRRSTGSFPESIESVTWHFPDGLPRDLATGEPYHYTRLDDGSYRLWGLGIDQTDQGGDPDKDVVWGQGIKPRQE
ncbi:MAG: hypothetical protein ACKV19_18440 [Verrucomicrobiales bacterium]